MGASSQRASKGHRKVKSPAQSTSTEQDVYRAYTYVSL